MNVEIGEVLSFVTGAVNHGGRRTLTTDIPYLSRMLTYLPAPVRSTYVHKSQPHWTNTWTGSPLAGSAMNGFGVDLVWNAIRRA